MFKHNSTKILTVLTILAVAASFFVFGFTVGRVNTEQASKYQILDEAQEHIDSLSLTRPGTTALIQSAVKGMVQGLDDPHAFYYTPQAYRALSEEMLTGQFSGVGIWMNRSDGFTKVVSVLPETPAAEAGIEPGDLIAAVDGEPVAGMTLEEVGHNIQGESGTRVVLKVVRGAGAPRDFTLSRRQLDIVSLTSSMEGDVGILNLISFTGGVGEKVREAVASMEADGARGFILDMRGNPGGSLDEAVQVASVFLDGGMVVAYRERGKPEVVHEARPPVESKLPVVVLVDEGSASASEIVAAAIQDHQRGLVVGTETYRKGSVQRLVGLSDGSALKLTIASYYTPSGKGIGEHGVLPDVTVEDRERQLPRATEILSAMLVEGPTRSTG